jgi:hypothetical protein
VGVAVGDSVTGESLGRAVGNDVVGADDGCWVGGFVIGTPRQIPSLQMSWWVAAFASSHGVSSASQNPG